MVPSQCQSIEPPIHNHLKPNPNGITSIQTKITQWIEHRPFIPGVPSSASSDQQHVCSSPRNTSSSHLNPFGTPIPPIDLTKTMRICLQNTQFSFQLYGDGLQMQSIMMNLKQLDANIFVPISPNINWNNQSNWLRTKQIFRSFSSHVHLSASSSYIGKDPLYFQKKMVGGSAIITGGIWTSKVTHCFRDTSGHGT
jgi:hypothetical protein